MSNLLSQNYRAGEKLYQGQIVAIDSNSPVYDPRVVAAKSGDNIIGICKNDCEADDLAVVFSMVPGQYQPVLVAEDVTAGDRLAITSDGDVVAYDGTQDGVEQLPLIAMGSGIGAIDSVGCRLATGAVDGDLEIDGDLNVKGDLSIGSTTITETDITYTDGLAQKSIAFKDLGGGDKPKYFTSMVREATKNGTWGGGTSVISYSWSPENNTITLTLPQGATGSLLVNGVIYDVTSESTTPVPVPFCKKVQLGSLATVNLKPYYESCTNFKVDGSITKL